MGIGVSSKRNGIIWKVVSPIFIGLLVVFILFEEDFDLATFSQFKFTPRAYLGVCWALFLWLLQNLLMSERYRLMTDKEISYRGGIRVNFLTEFTTVATPAIIGGSSVLFLFLAGEGVRAGKATAITFSGLFLDHICMAVACMMVLIAQVVSPTLSSSIALSGGGYIAFLSVTAVVVGWTVVIGLALFYKPEWIGRFIQVLARIKWLRRFEKVANSVAHDLVVTSEEMRQKSLCFWAKVTLLSLVAWVVRYAIVVALVFGFSQEGVVSFVVFIRQVMIWMISMVSPTPGGSGLAEYMFKVYYGEYFSSETVVMIVATIWRIITAYSYLIIGGIVLSSRLHRMGLRV